MADWGVSGRRGSSRALTAYSNARAATGLAGTVFGEGLDGSADGGFVGDVEVGELGEGGVVGFDGAVGGFEVWGGKWQSTL